MKKLAKKDKRSDLRKEYDNAVLLLKTCVPASEEYEAQLKQVERLHKLLMDEEDRKQRVTPDGLLTVAGNLLGIGIIVKHEEFSTITSKALSLVLKGRLR